MKARKKPVLIDFWPISSVADLLDIQKAGEEVQWRYAAGGFDVWNIKEHGWVHFPLGHYLIRGVAGEYYPCDPVVFEQTYEVEQ